MLPQLGSICILHVHVGFELELAWIGDPLGNIIKKRLMLFAFEKTPDIKNTSKAYCYVTQQTTDILRTSCEGLNISIIHVALYSFYISMDGRCTLSQIFVFMLILPYKETSFISFMFLDRKH